MPGTPPTAGAPGAPPSATRVTPGRADRAGTLDPRTRGGDAAATLAASRALLEAASVVVVTSDEPSRPGRRHRRGARLGIPLFVDGPGLADELDRLGTRTVLRWSASAPTGVAVTVIRCAWPPEGAR